MGFFQVHQGLFLHFIQHIDVFDGASLGDLAGYFDGVELGHQRH